MKRKGVRLDLTSKRSWNSFLKMADKTDSFERVFSSLSSHVRYANFPKFKFLSTSQELESISEFRNSRVWVLVNMEFIHLIAGFIFKDPAICSVHLAAAKKNKKWIYKWMHILSVKWTCCFLLRLVRHLEMLFIWLLLFEKENHFRLMRWRRLH